MFRHLTTLAVVLLASACANLVPLRQVSSAEAKWNSSGIQDYDYVVEVNALSPGTACSPRDKIEVQVRNRETVKFGTCQPNAELALLSDRYRDSSIQSARLGRSVRLAT
jgi:hypothetical protein